MRSSVSIHASVFCFWSVGLITALLCDRILLTTAFIPRHQHHHQHSISSIHKITTTGIHSFLGTKQLTKHRLQPTERTISSVPSALFAANANDPKNDDYDYDENDDDETMKEVMRQLELLTMEDEGVADEEISRSDSDSIDVSPEDLASILASAGVDADAAAADRGSKEMAEIALYKDMLEEVEGKKGDEVVLTEMAEAVESGVGFGKPPTPTEEELEPSIDKEDFLNTAVSEAIQNAQVIDTVIDPSSSPPSTSSDYMSFDNDEEGNMKLNMGRIASEISQDEEFRQEISDLFDVANKKMLANIEDMRKEQALLAASQGAARTEQYEKSVALENAKLEAAQLQMEKLVIKANKEKAKMQEAVDDLEAVKQLVDKEAKESGVDFLKSLRDGGQANVYAFVGFALFSSRAFQDVVLSFVWKDPVSHYVPAAVQAGLAVLCGVYVFVLAKPPPVDTDSK
mmetsp:Transcript_45802/g.55115  ORF Transcript_45802/g.55115 Transcript_45802/m.55115 type:complete len:457 (+) Transcript_45802:174-1544(+)